MGLVRIPHTFIDAASEIPSASKWNNNFSHINLVQTNLINNGDMELFSAGSSNPPDDWVLNGAGAAVASDADSFGGSLAAEITFGSADSYISQGVTNIKAYKGGIVKAWCRIKTSIPSQARIKIVDGVGSSSSPFHTGGGTYELLEVEHNVASGATEITLELHVESSGVALFDEAVLVDFSDITGFIPSRDDLTGAAGLTDTLIVLEGAFSARPATPTKKTLYFATDEEQFSYYSLALAKWVEVA